MGAGIGLMVICAWIAPVVQIATSRTLTSHIGLCMKLSRFGIVNVESIPRLPADIVFTNGELPWPGGGRSGRRMGVENDPGFPTALTGGAADNLYGCPLVQFNAGTP